MVAETLLQGTKKREKEGRELETTIIWGESYGATFFKYALHATNSTANTYFFPVVAVMFPDVGVVVVSIVIGLMDDDFVAMLAEPFARSCKCMNVRKKKSE